MSRKRKHRILVGPASQLPALFLLALSFLLGVVLGQAFAEGVSDAAGQELTRYLRAFVQVDRGTAGAGVFWQTLLLYFRYPAVAVLLGFASIGVLLLPCTGVLFGLLLSFSVSCFIAAFGPDGVLLALAVFGLRCAVTLPCYFLAAVSSLKSSAALASLAFGHGRRTAPVCFGGWHRFAAMGAWLLIASCVDLAISPWLLRLALERIVI